MSGVEADCWIRESFVMKKLLAFLIIVGCLCLGVTGCIDPDEALPHYYQETYP